MARGCAIAREAELAVNTVRKLLAEEELPLYGPGPLRPSKLDAFSSYLIERVQAARPHWIPATVPAREIRERGTSNALLRPRPGSAEFNR